MRKPIKLTQSELITLIEKMMADLEFLENIKYEEGGLDTSDENDRQNLISIIRKLKEAGVKWKKIGEGMYSAITDGQQVVRMRLEDKK